MTELQTVSARPVLCRPGTASADYLAVAPGALRGAGGRPSVMVRYLAHMAWPARRAIPKPRLTWSMCLRGSGRRRTRWIRTAADRQARTRHNVSMSTPRLKSIEHSTLWDRAYDALKSALLAGRFAPGERVVLRRVADDLGISLTPVRDAVNRLIAEKVLVRGGLGPAGAAMVPLLDEDQFNQLMIVRSSLEPIAAAAAAMHATPERIDAVEAFLVEMKRSVRENRTEQYLDAHYKFHFGIYAMCGMPVVEEIIESAWLRCAPALTLALPENIPSLKRYSSHVATIAALRKGDSEAAASAIRGDIESAREDIGAMLRERGRSK